MYRERGLVRHCQGGFPKQPFLQFARTTPGESTKLYSVRNYGKLLVSRFLARGVVNEIVGMQAKLHRGEA
ncbi:hypothetical protein X772_34680 [Mesorhizobium sp. LSJC280B00]|nr:hypothetical protein X772_34680 [Mesorhizobium sp. LSJC280B00]